MFSDKLNEYIKLTGAPAKEIAALSGLSEATLSRYRNGTRIPKEEDSEKLCRGLYKLLKCKGVSVSFNELALALKADLPEKGAVLPSFSKRLDALFTALSVNSSELSRALRYDSSYISRIKNSERKPSDPEKFASDTALFISRRYDSAACKAAFSALSGISEKELSSPEKYSEAIFLYLKVNESERVSANPGISSFLEKLDAFDLSEYIRAIHFDTLKVPTVPFELPVRKTYYTLEGMKSGEIDFLKSTATSRAQSDVFMFSDMPMDDMAKDSAFSKKYMIGLAAMLKRGLHLNVVHNLNRPEREIMIGLEGWIPLYMTGQISPYYLKNVHNGVFCRLLNVSGTAALAGECISSHHADGKYYFTKNKEELAYYRKRAEQILKKALPLMDICREENKEELKNFVLSDSEPGNYKSILSSPSIFTLDNEFLTSFLKKRNVPDEDVKRITDYASSVRRYIAGRLSASSVTDELYFPSEEEFSLSPPSLSLSGLFYEKDLTYTYDEFCRHVSLCEKFSKENGSYRLIKSCYPGFKNLSIHIKSGKRAIISKGRGPAIHFIVRHPLLLSAIEEQIFPLKD